LLCVLGVLMGGLGVVNKVVVYEVYVVGVALGVGFDGWQVFFFWYFEN